MLTSHAVVNILAFPVVESLSKFIPYDIDCMHPENKKATPMSGSFFVGVAGFEPTTSCSQSRRDTGLRYTPNGVNISFSQIHIWISFGKNLTARGWKRYNAKVYPGWSTF